LAGTVEARVVMVFKGPVNVAEAAAASANIPLPAIRPAVEVTIAAMAAAYRRTGVIFLRSLS
jgi:membrane carboxypeptidase/penicillin-binding protein PbpC